jgi:hypothetical protein
MSRTLHVVRSVISLALVGLAGVSQIEKDSPNARTEF